MARLEREKTGVWTLIREEDDEGRNADHDEALPRYLTALDPVFTRAREQSEFELILTLLRVRGLQDAGWHAYQTTLRAIPAVIQHTNRSLPRMRTLRRRAIFNSGCTGTSSR